MTTRTCEDLDVHGVGLHAREVYVMDFNRSVSNNVKHDTVSIITSLVGSPRLQSFTSIRWCRGGGWVTSRSHAQRRLKRWSKSGEGTKCWTCTWHGRLRGRQTDTRRDGRHEGRKERGLGSAGRGVKQASVQGMRSWCSVEVSQGITPIETWIPLLCETLPNLNIRIGKIVALDGNSRICENLVVSEGISDSDVDSNGASLLYEDGIKAVRRENDGLQRGRCVDLGGSPLHPSGLINGITNVFVIKRAVNRVHKQISWLEVKFWVQRQNGKLQTFDEYVLDDGRYFEHKTIDSGKL
mmetsp:Transcript_30980/g.65334  ORF Transcript_30980/g.65334 Transcript_30980/m.65334 type:complete len:296 (-) Transcript_30980:2872-3759(-)